MVNELEIKIKKSTLSKLLIFLIIAIIVIQGVIFLFPIKFEKYDIYTEKVQYNEQESYQQTVNYDGCDSSPSCVCSKRGGFLWLTCVQCSCTKQRTVVREKLVLKERTLTSSSTLYKKWTNSMVSEDEARQIIQKIRDYSSQNNGFYFNIDKISKQGDYWEVEISSGNDNSVFYVEGNTGRVFAIQDGENLTPIDISEVNR